MTTLREYLGEMVKYSRTQKSELQHFILNVLMNPNTAKLLKKSRVDNENITISKKEVDSILDNLKAIRRFIIDLPEEEK